MVRVEGVLREFACWLAGNAPEAACVADLRRRHIEACKLHLAGRPSARGGNLSKISLAGHPGALRACFERLTEWDGGDVPAAGWCSPATFRSAVEPLPRFLDDGAFTKLLQATRAGPGPFVRLAVEFLARTGLRKGEFLDLTVDSVVQIGAAYWLHVPLGKLRTDRYIPLHPQLKDLLDAWLAGRPASLRSPYLFTGHGQRIGQGPRRPGRRQSRPRRRNRPRQPAQAQAHAGHPGQQPGHEPGGDSRPSRPSIDADDHGVCPHRQPHRGRGILRGAGKGRGPPRRPEEPARRRRGHRDAQTPRRNAPAHARQRLLRPPRRPGLSLRVHLRIMHVLPDHHRVPPHPRKQRDDAAAKGQAGRKKIFDGLLSRLNEAVS